jgi:ADP-ribose pyrophosphatase
MHSLGNIAPMKLKETFVKRCADIPGKAVGFRIDEVRLVNGKTALREYLHHPGAVAVVAIDRGRILMVQQYRYPVKSKTWEIPAGKLDLGEDPRACAKRELEEETGYKAGRLRRLLSFWPTAAFADEIIHIFVATKLKKGKANPDEDEFLNCKAWKKKVLFRKIANGHIRDSKTLIGLLAWKLTSSGGRS